MKNCDKDVTDLMKLTLRKDRLGINPLNYSLFYCSYQNTFPSIQYYRINYRGTFFYCESYFAESSKISSATKSPIARV